MANGWHRKRTDAAALARKRQYDSPQHRRLRAAIQARIDQGQAVHCWRCTRRLHGHAWHLDHADNRASYRGPACIPCNLQPAARKGNRISNAHRHTQRQRVRHRIAPHVL